MSLLRKAGHKKAKAKKKSEKNKKSEKVLDKRF